MPRDDQVALFEGGGVVVDGGFYVVLDVFVGLEEAPVDFAVVVAVRVLLFEEVDVGEPVFDVPGEGAA